MKVQLSLERSLWKGGGIFKISFYLLLSYCDLISNKIISATSVCSFWP